MTRKLSLFLMLLVLGSGPASAAEVRIFAAASLTDALGEICALYGREHPDVKFVRNFAGSGTLAKQILAGAPADLFISAHPKWMETLGGEGRMAPESAGVLAENALVFVGPPATTATSLEGLPKLERIALGSPNSVPAGEYARQALTAGGLYDALLEKGRLVFAQDVRQALIYADRGEVDGAFVYRTDARLARRARVLFEVPPSLHDPVTYPLGLTVEGAKNPAATSFRDYLKSNAAKEVLQTYGFGTD